MHCWSLTYALSIQNGKFRLDSVSLMVSMSKSEKQSSSYQGSDESI